MIYLYFFYTYKLNEIIDMIICVDETLYLFLPFSLSLSHLYI